MSGTCAALGSRVAGGVEPAKIAFETVGDHGGSNPLCPDRRLSARMR